MFGWFKKKAPQKPETYGHELDVAFSNSEGNWNEKVDLVDIFHSVMQEKGHTLTKQEHSLLDPSTGFVFSPEFFSLDPGDGGVQTCTITTIQHPKWINGEIFEYQHSAGGDLAESFAKGFEMWKQTDFAVLKEVGKKKSEDLSQYMEMKLKDGRRRRILLGPIAHMVEDREAHEAASACSPESDEHPFCPCCLFTRSIEAFQPALESDDFIALRMFASRDENGQAASDCRINGHDDNPAMAALRRYVETWPQAGFEFRKQYVIIHSV